MKNPFRGKTYKVRCADGVKTLYHSTDDAFPLFVPGVELAGGADISAIPGAPAASVKAEYKSTVRAVMYGIDELNQSLMMEFRGAYETLKLDPCQNNAFFLRQMDTILANARDQTTWRMKARTLITLATSDTANRADIADILKELAAGLGGAAVAPAAAAEIERAREDAQRWLNAPSSDENDPNDSGVDAGSKKDDNDGG